MKSMLKLSCFLAALVLFSNCSRKDDVVTPVSMPKVLIFYKTAGFAHESIPVAIKALFKLGVENNIQFDTTSNAANFNSGSLDKYQTVIFLSTTGDILNAEEQNAFEKYIRSGKGFVGIHAAADAEYDWPWYGALVGAYFNGHPEIQSANIQVIDKNHDATSLLPETWQRRDEWYNFRDFNPDISVLAKLDESSYTGGTNGNDHPISWYHNFDGGRSFYTGAGHTNESYSEPLFLKHLLGGIKYAIGESRFNSVKDKDPSYVWTNLLDQNLTHWEKFIGVPHYTVNIPGHPSGDGMNGNPLGLHNDPLDVFKVVNENGTPLLCISGQIYGGLTTKQEYSDYHLRAEFKWGALKYEPRLNAKRDNGILYHATGAHGAFWNVWMLSQEFQVQEEDMGDYYSIGPGMDIKAEYKTVDNQTDWIFDPTAPLKPFGIDSEGRCRRGFNNEKANGEWNTLELICLGQKSIHVVNGKVVMVLENSRERLSNGTISPLIKGRIQIQSEGAEAYYRNIQIRQITEVPLGYR